MSVWDTLIGQPRAVEQLRRAAAAGTPSHAWLFTGPPGSGRSTAALAFAAALLCQQENPLNRGCGTCHSCQTVLRGSHADLTHFATENLSIKIDEARDLVVKAQDRPSVGRWRVMIIEDADRMPERTSNVLLKAIEEPPPHTIWLLCAPSPIDVLVTIRSRCRPLLLSVPAPAEVARLLSQQEGIPDDLALHCATLAQGHVGVARRLALSEQARTRREAVVRMPLSIDSIPRAMSAAQQLVDIANEEAEADARERNEHERTELMSVLGIDESQRITPSMRAQLRQLEEDQKRRARRIKTDTLDRFLIDIQTVFRDLLTIQLNTGSALVNAHLSEELHAQATQTRPEQTLKRLDTVALTRQRISTNAGALLAFEAMMASFV